MGLDKQGGPAGLREPRDGGVTQHGHRLIEAISASPTGRGRWAQLQIGGDWASLPDYPRQPQLSSGPWAGKGCFLVFALERGGRGGASWGLLPTHPSRSLDPASGGRVGAAPSTRAQGGGPRM